MNRNSSQMIMGRINWNTLHAFSGYLPESFSHGFRKSTGTLFRKRFHKTIPWRISNTLTHKTLQKPKREGFRKTIKNKHRKLWMRKNTKKMNRA